MLQVDPMILDGNIKLGLGGSDGRLRRILLYFCSSTFFFSNDAPWERIYPLHSGGPHY